jgi:glycosyltransferase involved in cell wall biosynthesis
VTKYLPGNPRHPGVQHAYFLTQYIRELTLIITKKDLSRRGFPLPSHAVLNEISYNDYALTSASEGKTFLQNTKRFGQTFRFLVRLLLKSREIAFFTKSIPVLMRFRPQIVHAHGLNTLAHGLFAKLFLRSRFVITIHNVTETFLVQKLPPLKYVLKCPDKIICVSDAIKQNLVSSVPSDKLEVIPTGFDPQLFKNLHLKRKHQMIAVGYLKWQKDYSNMIEAMIPVFSKFNDYSLLIIGDGPERAKIEKKITGFNLTGRVHLLGILPQDEIAKHLNESKLFIMSSLSEGLPKALLEATACGTPAVVTTACNAEGIINEVGIAVKPGDSQALAKAIEILLANNELWRRLSNNCIELAQNYRWDTISAKILNVYKRL